MKGEDVSKRVFIPPRESSRERWEGALDKQLKDTHRITALEPGRRILPASLTTVQFIGCKMAIKKGKEKKKNSLSI